MTDPKGLKSRLREYLTRRGIQIDDRKNQPVLRCPNPSHPDEHPSALLYDRQDDPNVTCPVCAASWDVFDIAGMLDNLRTFPEQLKAVQDMLGTAPLEQQKPASKKSDKSVEYVSLNCEKAKEVYTIERALEIYKFSKSSKLDKEKVFIAGSWPYSDMNDNIIGMDVRFEDGFGDKNVIFFWYNGQSLKTSNPPSLIYNLYEVLHTDKPILISEGAKAAEASRVMTTFVPCSWRGGTSFAGRTDWSLFAGREAYMLRDDDDPGRKAAWAIKEQLPQLRIVPPVPEAREIKDHGADAVEYLQVTNPDEMTKYILESCETEPPELSKKSPSWNRKDDECVTPSNSGGFVSDDSNMPFQILGIADDGRAYFIDESGRLQNWALESLSKSKLMILAPTAWWRNECSNRDGKVSWDTAIGDIVHSANHKDFDLERVRGRGAWKDNGDIVYFDGDTLTGTNKGNYLYPKQPKVDIGIGDAPAQKDLTLEIEQVVLKMSFETRTDAIRCLAWSALAPFSGALPIRPVMLLTGDSGSGKSTVTNQFIKKLAMCRFFNGAETTVAGVRGKVKKDSGGIVFEETESTTEKMATNRDELFSLARVNVTDDAPDTVKGTKEGGFQSYKMQNMFGFIGIDPTIENVADENRIFRINMIIAKNQDKWQEIEKEINALITDDNCRAIRALTWKKLKCIIEQSKILCNKIMSITRCNYRTALSDGLLIAAFMIVWRGYENPTDEELTKFFNQYYTWQAPEDKRNESEEIINQITDEVIEILHDTGRKKMTILECLKRICYPGDIGPSYIRETRETVARYGVMATNKGDIVIANNHKAIMKITRKGQGYQKILKRHPGFIKSDIHYFPDKPRRCSFIKGIILSETDEQLEKLFD